MATRTHRALSFAALVFVLTLLGLIIPASSVRAQTLTPWTGTYSASGRAWTGWDETMTGTVEFEYAGYSAGTPGHHSWTLKGGTFNWEATGSVVDCAVSGSLAGSLSADPDTDVGVINVYDDGTYFAELIFDSDRTQDLVIWDCPVGQLKNNGQISRVMHTVGTFHVKNSGTTLSERVQGVQPHDWVFFDWNLTSAAIPETELVFRADENLYADWLPTAGEDESDSGSPITITATLRNTDGSPLTRKAEAFMFELVDVSKEPGIALNYPKSDALSTPDLKFTGADSEIFLLDPLAKQFIIVKPTEADGVQTATVVVSPYDFGAFGSVKVKATLGGGDEPIVGTLETNAERTELLLPRRVEGSNIATAWKQQHGLPASSDDDDSDALPEGDGHEGDGLTLYEEYRGFHVGGVHRRTNPNRKTILVRDAVGGAVKQGTQLYRQITGLEVLDRLLAGEFDAETRVINGNHEQGAHIVDQHALWIRYTGRPSGQAVSTTEEPATPKRILYIELPALEAGEVEYEQGGRKLRSNPLAAMVAHELLHGSNVWHHGDDDIDDAHWRLDRDAGGKVEYDAEGYPVVLEGLVHIVQPRRESGERFTPVWLSQIIDKPDVAALVIPTIAVEHGQHSGDENCVMRYDSTWFYTRSAADAARFEVPDGEHTGMSLCSSPIGTGVNAPNRQPQYRYGDANQTASDGPARRGDCKHQLCINDRYH